MVRIEKQKKKVFVQHMPITFWVHAQSMAGARKWKLDLLDRNDPITLTERASKVPGIPLSEEAEEEAIEKTRLRHFFSFHDFLGDDDSRG